MKKAIRVLAWGVLSPVYIAQLIPLLTVFYTRHLFRRAVRKQPIPGLREFWANPKA
ncbi:hypothetical protein [Caballeronia sp. LZ035]|uniref:hypothetical protein n=1 Tax=Caballeronia sp. LZ035 TaxID=3038568 RepID=UPI0028601ED0|nr:hypothetical protein [Caballeronia sp. LZ035]MDR5758195.1 hypothetical protein [Caballeronia sp. LZ035]